MKMTGSQDSFPLPLAIPYLPWLHLATIIFPISKIENFFHILSIQYNGMFWQTLQFGFMYLSSCLSTYILWFHWQRIFFSQQSKCNTERPQQEWRQPTCLICSFHVYEDQMQVSLSHPHSPPPPYFTLTPRKTWNRTNLEQEVINN